MALFLTFLGYATGSANLNGQFFARGITNEFTRLLLDIFGGTSRLIDSLTNIFALSIAVLDGFFNSLLFEGDLTSFFKVLFTDFFLSGCELCNISIMTFLNIFVGAFQDGILLDGCNSFFFFYTTKTSFFIIDTAIEVYSSRDFGRGFG